MNIEDVLKKIWAQNYIFELPDFIHKRGYCYSKNNSQKDILITGINPSFREGSENFGSFGFDIQDEFKNNKHDNYWGPLKKMVYDESQEIDLRPKTSYLDIFYFREKKQKVLKNELLPNKRGLKFLAEQLNLTQHIIEDVIKPKLVIVKNKESSGYWGKLADKSIFWMGYDLEFIESSIIGELFKIKGLINSSERIAPEIRTTNLNNSLILFTSHITQYTKREKRPTGKQIKELLDRTLNENCK